MLPGDYAVREIVPENFRQTTPGLRPPRLFATNINLLPDVIYELDPLTGAVLRGLPSPVPTGSSGQGLAFDGETLYYITTSNSVLYELDPRTGAVRDSMALAPGGYTGLATRDGLVYLFNDSTDEILTIDPKTNAILNSYDLNLVNPGKAFAGALGEFSEPGWLVIGAAGTSSEIYFLDPQTGVIVDSFSDNILSGRTGLAGIGDEVYVGYSNNTIRVFDTEGNLLRTIATTFQVFSLGGDSSDGSHRVTLEPAQILTGLDFGNQNVLGEIRGTKFEDVDGDGVRDLGEGPLRGVTVYLDRNDDGQLDLGQTVEPDDYPEGAVLNEAVEGVTFSVANFLNSPTSIPVLSVTNPSSSTGSKVFASGGVPFWTDGFRFRADFDQPVSSVSLDFIASFNGQVGTMLVFGSNGNLLETISTETLNVGVVETMLVSRPEANIAYIVAYTLTGSFGRLDNFVFGTPELSTVTDANGDYAFTSLPPGHYVVREIVPENFRQTTPQITPPRLFATNINISPDVIFELDPVTGAILRELPSPIPVSAGGHGLAFDGETLYYISADNDVLYELNPETGDILDSFQLPPGGYTGAAVLDGWLYVFDDGPNLIHTIDPTNNLIVRSYDLNVTNPASLFSGGLGEFGMRGWLLIGETGTGSAIHFLDPETGESVGSFSDDILSGRVGLTGIGDEIYVGYASNAIRVFDPQGNLLRTIATNFQVFSLGGHSSDGSHRVTLEPAQILTGLDFGNQLSRPPVAVAGGPYEVNEGGTVILDASASFDPDGDAMLFEWDLDGDGIFGETGTGAERGDETGINPVFDATSLDGPLSVNVTLRVADPFGNTDEDVAAVSIQNVDPTINTLGLDAVVIDENGTARLTGTFTDPGTSDTHTIEIHWGDGTNSILTVSAGERSFAVEHVYLDDNPSGDPANSYPIAVTLTDDDDGSDQDSVEITVRNLKPVITSLSTTAATVGSRAAGEAVEISGMFTDLGALDTHTATIFWGDGTSTSADITQGSGSGMLAGSHIYETGGFFEIVVVLTDDDTGNDSASVFAFVTGVRIADGMLQIVGSAGADQISVNDQGDGTIRVHGEFLNAPVDHVTLPGENVQRIGVFLGDGDDEFSVAGNIYFPLFVNGGSGNDIIKAGGGQSLLIGGTGADQLIGGWDQDILIGGTTDFDLDPNALSALLAEWASERSLEERVANLFDGSGTVDRLNGNTFLTVGEDGTIDDDDEADNLTGRPNTDWFFFDPALDTANDLQDEIFANALDELLDP